MAEHFDEALRDLEEGARPPEEGLGVGRESADFDAHPAVAALKAAFGDAVLRHDIMAGDESVVFVQPERLLEIMRFLKEDEAQRFDLLKDVTAVDFGGGRPLQVVYELWSIPNRRQLRVKAELPLDALEVDSVQPLWKTADWLERECYDMFGIQFRGHPDLRRILMPEHYAEGHPLRKDFPLRGRFTRAEQTRRALSMEVSDFYIPEELRFIEEAGAAVAQGAAQDAAVSDGPTGEWQRAMDQASEQERAESDAATSSEATAAEPGTEERP